MVNGKASAASYAKNLEASRLCMRNTIRITSMPLFTRIMIWGGAQATMPGKTVRAQTKLGNALNLLSGGSVFLYYGEELNEGLRQG